MRFSGDEGVIVMDIPVLRGKRRTGKESNNKMRGSGDVNLYIYPSNCELAQGISSNKSALTAIPSPKVERSDSQHVE